MRPPWPRLPRRFRPGPGPLGSGTVSSPSCKNAISLGATAAAAGPIRPSARAAWDLHGRTGVAQGRLERRYGQLDRVMRAARGVRRFFHRTGHQIRRLRKPPAGKGRRWLRAEPVPEPPSEPSAVTTLCRTTSLGSLTSAANAGTVSTGMKVAQRRG